MSLLCFPHAGGSTATFYRWRRWLEKGIHVIPICLPGRDHRFHEPPFRRMDALLASLAPAVANHIQGPMWLFGHSFGALIGFELAKWLEASGRGNVQGVLLSSCPAASLLPRSQRSFDLPDELLLERLIDDYGYATQDPAKEREFLALMLPTLRADVELFETYAESAREPLQAPLVALGGSDDRRVPRSDLEAWRSHTSSHFQCRLFPGGHFYLLHQSEALAGFIERRVLHA